MDDVQEKKQAKLDFKKEKYVLGDNEKAAMKEYTRYMHEVFRLRDESRMMSLFRMITS